MLKESVCNSVRTLLGLLPEESESDFVWYFRGHANKQYELKPSIYRDKRWYSNEEKMIKEILIRCPSDFSGMSSSFEKLVKMQHYDLPTRLLDLTENPLVALYFACVGSAEKEVDGEILFFKIPKFDIKYFDSDTVSVISNLAWAKNDFELKKHFKVDSKGFHSKSNPHSLKLMHDIRQEKPHFLPLIDPAHLESVVCVKAKLDNPRVIRQDGAFLLFGIKDTKHTPAEIPVNWRFYPDEKRYVIKAKEKASILKQLSSLGISKGKLFPEIDTVAQYIKNDFGLDKNEFTSSILSNSPRSQFLIV